MKSPRRFSWSSILFLAVAALVAVGLLILLPRMLT